MIFFDFDKLYFVSFYFYHDVWCEVQCVWCVVCNGMCVVEHVWCVVCDVCSVKCACVFSLCVMCSILCVCVVRSVQSNVCMYVVYVL